MLKDDLAGVAIELIREFGAVGKFLKNDTAYDPIFGTETGTKTELKIDFFIEPYKSKELIENKILEGDAKLYTYDKPLDGYELIDNDGVAWNIVNNQIVPYWVQGVAVAYVSHVRRK